MYMTMSEAGRRLGVSRQRISEGLKSGKIRGVELGGRVFVLEESLEDWSIVRKVGRPRRKYRRRNETDISRE